MRIGIILTDLKSEIKKEEAVRISTRRNKKSIRHWAVDIGKPYIGKSGKKLIIPGDVLIGMYIKWKHPRVQIDLGLPRRVRNTGIVWVRLAPAQHRHDLPQQVNPST